MLRRQEPGMGRRISDGSESRFAAYVEGIVEVIGHADRAGPLSDYCTGLMMPGERKSVEPMAALTAPARTAAQHQSLLHFVGQSAWSDAKVLAKVRELVLPKIECHGPIEAWIIDDTGFPKKGKHSVGVARQYCGQLGKQDNCQVAVSLSIANHHASLPVAYRLYLPEDWTKDRKRLRKVGVPAEVGFKTKPEIALEQIEAACAAGLPRGVVAMDAGYGCNTDLRTGVSALGLRYVAGILPNTSVWAPGTGPLPPKKWSGRGRQPKLIRRDDKHRPVPVKELALNLPKRAWRTIAWREGEKEPTKYWLSTLPKDITFRALVDLTKLRWRIERDYQELKQEVGLGHFEGRGWRGFHHHATLCITAYGFLVSERETIPPCGPRSARPFEKLTVPNGYRPRGSAAANPTTRPELDRDTAHTPQRRPRQQIIEMPMLRNSNTQKHTTQKFVTQ